MPIHYINYNGSLLPEDDAVLSVHNRSFRYGDGLFETMLWKDGDIRFLKFHVARLQKGMKILQLDEYTKFDEFFIRGRAEELIRKNNLVGKRLRLRLIVFRSGEGLYSPQSNKPVFVLQVHTIDETLRDRKVGLIVDLYTEYKKPYSELACIKSNNAMIYVLAGLHKKKFSFDEVLILNQEGYLCEALSANVFVYYEKILYTPAISEGCIEGVMRRVVMDMAVHEGIPVVEAQISPEIMKRADEIFCTNAVQGIQWVMGYKHKRYFNKIARLLEEKLRNWQYEIID